MKSKPARARRSSSPKPVTLRIELLDIQPLIWRRIVVPDQATLADLHRWLQEAMGWQDTHAHEFEIGDHIVAPAWWIAEMASGASESRYQDESRILLSTLIAELGVSGEFEYRYDMGDGWTHRIVIEAPPPPTKAQLPLPRCAAGENACPPDDVGGPPGYAEFLAALADPAHSDHVRMHEWIGGVFDPKGFDLNGINRSWREAD